MSTNNHLASVCFADYQQQPISWPWPNRIPGGKLTLIDGDPGQGKSFLTLDLAARLTTAQPFPDGFTPSEPSSVILILAEDAVADTVLPRLRACGADLSRIYGFSAPSGPKNRPPIFPDDCDSLEIIIRQTNARLVIIDPLLAFLSPRVSSLNNQTIRQALDPLAALAEATQVAILCNRHLNKSISLYQAIYRGTGAIGIIGSARVAYLVAQPPDEPNVRLLACTKNNLGPLPSTLAFKIAPNPDGLPAVHWLGERDIQADQLLKMKTPSRTPTTPTLAAEFLQNFLKDGPCSRELICRRARAAGVTNRALRSAKVLLHIASKQIRFHDNNLWYWRLPNDTRPFDPEANHQRLLNDVFKLPTNDPQPPTSNPQPVTSDF